MKLTKKLAILGIIGSLTIGQSVSALAATTYSVGNPSVTVNVYEYSDYTYSLTGSVSASAATSYLRAEQYFEYNLRGSSSHYYTTKQLKESDSKTTSLTYTSTVSGHLGDHIGYLAAYNEGYYLTSKPGTAYYISRGVTTNIPSPY